MRGDIALAARVGVRAPGATDVAGSLEHDEVRDPGSLQTDRGADSRESRRR